jgi:hypothetical protein
MTKNIAIKLALVIAEQVYITKPFIIRIIIFICLGGVQQQQQQQQPQGGFTNPTRYIFYFQKIILNSF